MSTVADEPRVSNWTVADLFDRFGPILLSRIRFDPAPGTATEDDVVEIHEREKRLFELVDGVLIEKTYDLQGSYLAALIADLIASSPDGLVLGPDGMARLAPGLIRIPDVSFIAWERFPGRVVPREPMVGFAPTLPSKSSARATRSRRWTISSATTSGRASASSGTSTPGHGPSGSSPASTA
jgi:hypothetical protein